jgi:hypothetical protein
MKEHLERKIFKVKREFFSEISSIKGSLYSFPLRLLNNSAAIPPLYTFSRDMYVFIVKTLDTGKLDSGMRYQVAQEIDLEKEIEKNMISIRFLRIS